jgi:hypothetical protein
METSSVMRFEDLLKLWQDSPSDTSIFQLLGLTIPSQYQTVKTTHTSLQEMLRERLRGTWWEVTWPRFSARNVINSQVRCRYLADSLPDAIRLRPLADFPAHPALSDPDELSFDELVEEPVQESSHIGPMGPRRAS